MKKNRTHIHITKTHRAGWYQFTVSATQRTLPTTKQVFSGPCDDPIRVELAKQKAQVFADGMREAFLKCGCTVNAFTTIDDLT